MKRIVLAGGSGFLGRLLARHFVAQGDTVAVLTRSPGTVSGAVGEVAWDGRTIGDWCRELEGADVLINLAGRSVDCRYHARNRREILESRVGPTRALGQALGRCARPPRVWLNASTATIYKHSFDRPMDEATGIIAGTPEAKDVFSVDVAEAWEAAFAEASVPATRKVALRMAMVFGLGANSVFPVLRRLVRLGLGGRMAGGNQYVSWIHHDDLCRAVDWLIAHDGISGPVNLAAPEPLTNCDMMRRMREAFGVPLGLPAARWMLEAGAFVLRTETELIIKSRRVIPGRLLALGFEFRYPTFGAALAELVVGHK